MKNSILYYSVGALLYCPANNETAASSIIHEKFGTGYSLAFCLEDTIKDDCVLDAEEKLFHTLNKVFAQYQSTPFYLPKIFIRVRNPKQILNLAKRFGQCMEIISGFVIPKFSPENADCYIQNMIRVNESSKKPLYMMPIYESSSIVDLRYRSEILYDLKDKLDQVENLVLNVRVGGNDLCHLFGFRRHKEESIHQIRPISNIFSDIVTVYGTDYVISGPVWEYYNGDGWREGLKRELAEDKLCGFTGKTIIHPNQIEVVNDSLRVLKQDLEDAQSILNWNQTSNSLVSGSLSKERMNEYKTHSNWALQTLLMAEAFGTK